MNSLFDSVVRARALIENEGSALTPLARDALRQLVDFTLAANPPPADEAAFATRSQHLVYMHPNNQHALFFEPGDPWTPYYEWGRTDKDLSGWMLLNRHAWRADALLIFAGKALPPRSSRPPPLMMPGKVSYPPVQIMPLEDQVRQVLTAAKAAGRFHGFLFEAVRALEQEGFSLDEDPVKDAVYRVTRGTPFHLEVPALRQATP